MEKELVSKEGFVMNEEGIDKSGSNGCTGNFCKL